MGFIIDCVRSLPKSAAVKANVFYKRLSFLFCQKDKTHRACGFKRLSSCISDFLRNIIKIFPLRSSFTDGILVPLSAPVNNPGLRFQQIFKTKRLNGNNK